MKKSKGAAEEVERREEGVVEDGEDVEAEEKRVLVGSNEFWRWRRFESIAMKASSIFTLSFLSLRGACESRRRRKKERGLIFKFLKLKGLKEEFKSFGLKRRIDPTRHTTIILVRDKPVTKIFESSKQQVYQNQIHLTKFSFRLQV